MKLWQPDHRVVGPLRATVQDTPELNRVFSEAFTDRYRRDGMVGVRVPQLNPAVWRYALEDAGDGAMVWRDEDGTLLAFNMVHRSGTEGWMGPLAVRPDRQGLGLGRSIVQSGIAWLEEHGAATIGLETMPRTVDNIGFYGRLGFVPGFLTITMVAEVSSRRALGREIVLGRLKGTERDELLRRCQERLQQSAPGYDFTREHQLTAALDLGDTVVLEQKGVVRAFALWHSAPLAESRAADEVRVLKLFADGPESFGSIIGAVEGVAAGLRVRRVAVRCQTRYQDAYRALVGRNYGVRWTDLRMTLADRSEEVVEPGATLFSNWEI